jgi:hypothetical protein
LFVLLHEVWQSFAFTVTSFAHQSIMTGEQSMQHNSAFQMLSHACRFDSKDFETLQQLLYHSEHQPDKETACTVNRSNRSTTT